MATVMINVTQIKPQGIACPDAELHDQGFIKMQTLADLFHLLRLGIVASQQHRRVSGGQMCQRENENGHQHENGYRCQQSAENIKEHPNLTLQVRPDRPGGAEFN